MQDFQCLILKGTGKSSTIAKYTGQDVAVSRGASSMTRHCEVYSNLRDPTEPVWIDTVGYDDSKNLRDEDSFREVLKFIDKHNVRDVHAIVWTVMPQERMDARLQKQANFINQFGEGLIWNNVVIVAKQPGSFNLEQATQGPREAAKQHCYNDTQIKTTGFTYMDDSIPIEVQESVNALPEAVRNKMLLVTDDQVHAQLHKLLMIDIKRPVQVVFRDSKCLDCGAQGDSRILENHCHMEMIMMHPQSAAYFHPSLQEPYHPMETEVYHSGLLRVHGGPNKECETVRNVMTGVTPAVFFMDLTGGILSATAALGSYYVCNYLSTPIEEKWTCCGGLNGSRGCKVRWSCCKSANDNQGCCVRYPCCLGSAQAQGCQRRYKCCGQMENSAGCEKICKKCGSPWGSPSQQCFIKNHNLVKIH